MGTSKLRGTPKVMLGGDLGLASHPGGRGNTTSCFMLRKRDKFRLGANRLECRLNLAVSSPIFLIPSVRLHTLVSGQANSDS